MTNLHLYGNKFWDWPGWTVLKWIAGVLLTVSLVYLIWSLNVSKPPIPIYLK